MEIGEDAWVSAAWVFAAWVAWVAWDADAWDVKRPNILCVTAGCGGPLKHGSMTHEGRCAAGRAMSSTRAACLFECLKMLLELLKMQSVDWRFTCIAECCHRALSGQSQAQAPTFATRQHLQRQNASHSIIPRMPSNTFHCPPTFIPKVPTTTFHCTFHVCPSDHGFEPFSTSHACLRISKHSPNPAPFSQFNYLNSFDSCMTSSTNAHEVPISVPLRVHASCTLVCSAC